VQHGRERRAGVRLPPGNAVQVDPIIPKLKPPDDKRWKLKYDKVHSIVAFNLSLRRYIQEWDGVLSDGSSVLADARKQGTGLNPGNGGNDECGGNAGASTGVMRGFMDVSCWAGAYTRPFSGST